MVHWKSACFWALQDNHLMNRLILRKFAILFLSLN